MYRYSLLLLATFSLFIVSQEMSQEYLNSLPEEIRDDVMNRMNEKKEQEDAVYRSIDSSGVIEKKAYDSTEIFGSYFFNTIQTSFMPINDPNLDDSYVLDYGDVLSIQLIGQNDSIDSFALARDGSINIPDVGKLYVAGLTLQKASAMIDAKIKQIFIGTVAFTSLKNIRDVSILVAGNAYNPGIYTLNGASNMLHALHSAGGINEYGSYRTIKLIRDGETIDILDIYDILIYGKLKANTRLRNGDIVFVEPRSKVVTVEGGFKRSAKYELLENQSLYDAVEYANGIVTEADLSNIFLYRVLDGAVKSIPLTGLSQFKEIKPNDKDRIYVRRHSFRNITISGAINRPGIYKMVEGQNIYDLIDSAGGYSSNAFPDGAVYLNNQAKSVNADAINKLYFDFLDGILELSQKGGSSEGVNFSSLVSLASEIKNTEPNGRIVIDLSNDSSPVLVKDNDSLFIPEVTNNIFIFGEVLNEGSLLHKQGADLDFYINEASGLKQTADSSSIYILFPNGRTQKLTRKRNLFAGQPEKIAIVPGSVIYVPREIDNTLATRLSAQAYASILGNIGVSLASLAVLND